MLDAGLRVTFRHFWTFFFVAAAITVPLHLIYVFAWHGAIGLRELGPQIQQFPPARQVHYVGARDLQHARLALWIIDAAELALLPMGIRAARGVLATDERGEVTTASKGWRYAFRKQQGHALRPGPWIPGAFLIGAAVGALCDAIGRMLAEPLGINWSFVVLGLSQGAARAVGAAFFLGPAALAAEVRSGVNLSRGGLP